MSEYLTATKVPPHDANLEKCLVSSAMHDRDTLADAREIIPSEDMLYHAGARVIYGALLEMDSQGLAIDLQLVSSHLYQSGKLEQIGGYPGLEDVFRESPTRANAVFYARKVRDLWVLRQMAMIGTDMSRDAMEMAGGEPAEIRAKYEQELFSLGEVGIDGKPVTSVQVSHSLMDMADRYANGERVGLGLGFLDIDKIFCGMAPKSVTILAGRPGGGKSKLAGNVIVNTAKEGKPVMLYSLEMTNEEIGMRMACALGNIDHFRLIHNMLSADEQKRLHEAFTELGQLPIHWQDRPGLKPSELRASLRRMKRRHGIELAVVDHMLLMQPDKKSQRSRNDEVGEISRMLKLSAKEANIAMLALCQMNRAVEGRADDTPRLSDLRDSGNIEQDADAVLFLHRKAARDGEPQPTTVDVHIAKQRNGPPGKATLFDRAGCFRFENYIPGFAR